MIIKRLAHPLAKRKKEAKFIVAPRGPHPLERSIALATLLRDYLGYVETYKEAKKVIKQGKIMVDGRVIKDHKFGVGVFDVIEIPDMKKVFRILPKKEKLEVVEISENEAKLKLCKIVGKRAVKGGRIQLNLHDGRNILADNSYNTQDSLLIELPSQKIVSHFPLKEKMLGFVFAGKNAGKIGVIEKIERGWRLNRVLMKNEEEEFWVPFKNLIVVGESEPAITVKVDRGE
jgi:small subunit ribosomal protein S4e